MPAEVRVAPRVPSRNCRLLSLLCDSPGSVFSLSCAMKTQYSFLFSLFLASQGKRQFPLLPTISFRLEDCRHPKGGFSLKQCLFALFQSRFIEKITRQSWPRRAAHLHHLTPAVLLTCTI